MMTVHKVGGEDAGGYAGYLAGEPLPSRRGDYYLGREGEYTSSPGRWHGRGSDALGLNGEVSRRDLMAVWEGRDPRTGEIEVLRSGTGEHVAAIDCTFSAPKSVSVMWATSHPALREQFEVAQTDAVNAAIDHVESTVSLQRRRVAGDLIHERSDGLVTTIFRHHTSRLSPSQEDENAVPDPQLHDHVAVANMAKRPASEGENGTRWGAIDSRELYRAAAEAGAVYRAELANKLQRLGFQIERDGRYFEVVGVPDRVRAEFSTRTRDVEKVRREFVNKYGRAPSVPELKALTVRTRRAKCCESADPFPAWQDRAEAAGFRVSDVPRSGVDRSPIAAWDHAVKGIVAELTDASGDRSLTRTAAVFDTRQLRIATAEAAQGRVTGHRVAALIDAVSESPALIRLDDQHWTTRTMRDAELEVLNRARMLHGETASGVAPGAIDESIRHASVPLSTEQQAAARALTQPQRLHLLVAPAGAGKGEVLRVVASAHHASGHNVVALAAAGETALRLQKQTDANTSWTIDGYIRGVDAGRIRPDPTDVVIVDEAALVETMRWRDLLASTGSAAVIAAGDAGQLPAIEAGGIWPVLEREVGAQKLTENFRANTEWAADAWTALRDGRSAEGLEAMQEHGHIRFAANRSEARDEAVALWDRLRQGDVHDGDRHPSVLLLSDSSNREVDQLNEAAQHRRLAAGELGSTFVEVTAPHRSGSTWRNERLHPGDHVVLQRRLRDMDGQTLALNGATGTVTGADPHDHKLAVELASGSRITLEGEEVNAARLGYARHVYSAQGTTVDRAVVVTGGWQTGRESSYVGVSRAREESYVMSDLSSLGLSEDGRDRALPALAERMARSRAQHSSLDFAPSETERRAATDESTHTSVRDPELAQEPRPAKPVWPERPRAAEEEVAAPEHGDGTKPEVNWTTPDTARNPESSVKALHSEPTLESRLVLAEVDAVTSRPAQDATSESTETTPAPAHTLEPSVGERDSAPGGESRSRAADNPGAILHAENVPQRDGQHPSANSTAPEPTRDAAPADTEQQSARAPQLSETPIGTGPLRAAGRPAAKEDAAPVPEQADTVTPALIQTPPEPTRDPESSAEARHAEPVRESQPPAQEEEAMTAEVEHDADADSAETPPAPEENTEPSPEERYAALVRESRARAAENPEATLDEESARRHHLAEREEREEEHERDL